MAGVTHHSPPSDDFDPNEVDPEQMADEMVEIINEERRSNWPERGRDGDVSVSGIPPSTWMTSRTMTNLRLYNEAATKYAVTIDALGEQLTEAIAHAERMEQMVYDRDRAIDKLIRQRETERALCDRLAAACREAWWSGGDRNGALADYDALRATERES